MNIIDPYYNEDFPSDWTNKDKYQFYMDRANNLVATGNQPFSTNYEKEWYLEALEYYMKRYMHYYKIINEDQKIKTRLTPVMFVTYSPRQDVGLKQSQKAVKDYLDKQKIKHYIYVIEQAGTTEQDVGKHIHYHMLVTHEYDRISHFVRETQSSFRKTCNVDNWSCLNIKPCDTDVDISNRLTYMLGKKKDVDALFKTEKQEMDKVFRLRYKIENFYTDDYTNWSKYREE